MGADADEAYFGCGRIEGLDDDLAKLAAVDRIGEITGKTGEIERLGTAQPDLLIRHEGDMDVAVRVLRRQFGQQGHDDRNRGFVLVPSLKTMS